ncbi:MAG: haloacid dehalogenase-like hydrolase [Ilumatobacteraceae bacterium]
MSAPSPIVLWDVDGTLLRAAKAGTRSFVSALRTVAGAEWPTAKLDFGGRTDPKIAELILDAAGCDLALAPRLLAEVQAEYERREAEFAADTWALTGVHEVIAALDDRGVVQGLVTGNLEPVARIKVRGAGLGAPLRFDVGGYGSDHIDRAELVATAMCRAEAAGLDVDRQRVWVIGDTRRDLACARDNGVRCALVATGTTPFETLAELGADLTIRSLEAPEVAELIEAIAAPAASTVATDVR